MKLEATVGSDRFVRCVASGLSFCPFKLTIQLVYVVARMRRSVEGLCIMLHRCSKIHKRISYTSILIAGCHYQSCHSIFIQCVVEEVGCLEGETTVHHSDL